VKQSTPECPRVVVGMDLSDKTSHVFAVDGETGEVLEDGKIANRPAVIEARFRAYEHVRVVLEAGAQSAWISELLVKLGHEVLVANPRRIPLITENDRKSDRVDAQMLARLGRVAPDLLVPVWNRPSETRGDLAQIRARDALVRSRTQLVNFVRATVKLFGGRLKKCSAASFHKLDLAEVPELARPATSSVLEAIAHITASIKDSDKAIAEVAKEKYPETERLRQVHGVGPITALAFVLTVGDPARFSNSRTLASYFGLRPRQCESGESSPQLRITKSGNGYMRRLLVCAAQHILGPFGEDSDLRRWGMKLFERGGKNAKKRAVVAVARKLTILLHRLWVTGDAYEPLRETTRRSAAASGHGEVGDSQRAPLPPAGPVPPGSVPAAEGRCLPPTSPQPAPLTLTSVSTTGVDTHSNDRSQSPSPDDRAAPLGLEEPSGSLSSPSRRLRRPNSADSNMHGAQDDELQRSANGSVASGLLRPRRSKPVANSHVKRRPPARTPTGASPAALATTSEERSPGKARRATARRSRGSHRSGS
jgi:transposase